jgi:hypothetical protein
MSEALRLPSIINVGCTVEDIQDVINHSIPQLSGARRFPFSFVLDEVALTGQIDIDNARGWVGRVLGLTVQAPSALLQPMDVYALTESQLDQVVEAVRKYRATHMLVGILVPASRDAALQIAVGALPLFFAPTMGDLQGDDLDTLVNNVVRAVNVGHVAVRIVSSDRGPGLYRMHRSVAGRRWRYDESKPKVPVLGNAELVEQIKYALSFDFGRKMASAYRSRRQSDRSCGPGALRGAHRVRAVQGRDPRREATWSR